MEKRNDELHRTIDAYHAWTRDVDAEVLVYFDGIDEEPVIFDRDSYLVDFELLEELTTDSDHPIGPITANELSITLFNRNNELTIDNEAGPYYGKINTRVPIKVRVRESLANTDWLYLGTYYISDWASSTSSQLVSVIAYDELYFTMKEELPALTVQTNITLEAFIKRLLQSINIDSSRVIVSNSIKSIVVPYAYPLQGAISNTLSELSKVYMFYFYLDRAGNYRVLSITDVAEPSDTFDEDFIFSDDTTTSLLRSYSKIAVFYDVKTFSNIVELASISDVEVPNGLTTIENLAPSNGPIVSLEYVKHNSDVTMRYTDYMYNAWFVGFKINNDTQKIANTTFTLYGQTLDTETTACVYAESADLKQRLGDKTLEVKHEFINNVSTAERISRVLLNYTLDEAAVITVTHKGNPVVEVGEYVTIDTRTHSGNRLLLSQTLTYNGGLSGTSKLIRIGG